MESKEYKVWLTNLTPPKEVIINAIQLTEQNISDIDKFVNTWPEPKIPHKSFTRFLRCNRIMYSENEANGQFRKIKG